MRAQLFLGFSTCVIGCALAALGCSQGQPSPTLPQPDTNLGLGDVVMMTWTTRSVDGLLGHVMLPSDEIGIDPQRRPIAGDVALISTSQTLRVVLSVERTAGLGAGYGPVGASATAGHLTHIAYDVRITGYAEILPQAQHYLSDSGCCLGGAVAPSCGPFFVARMMRGSGTVQYLQQIDGKASVSAAHILRAEGGLAFRKLSSSSFEDTFFAYEMAPLDSVCSRLSPEEEMPAIQIAAQDNCFLTVFHRNGSRHSKSFHLPSVELCAKVVAAACEEAEHVIECQAHHGRQEQTRVQVLAGPSQAPAMAPQPAIAVEQTSHPEGVGSPSK